MPTIGTQTPDLGIRRLMMLTPAPDSLTSASQKDVHELTTHSATPFPPPVSEKLSLRVLGAFGSLKHQLPGLLAWCLKETLDFPSLQPGVRRVAILYGVRGPEFDSATGLWLLGITTEQSPSDRFLWLKSDVKQMTHGRTMWLTAKLYSCFCKNRFLVDIEDSLLHFNFIYLNVLEGV